MLLRSNEQLYRRAFEIPPFAQFVLQEPAVRLFDVLRQVGEEHKGRNLGVRQLRTVFDFDVFALPCGWGIVLYQRQEFLVQLRGRDFLVLVFIYVQRGFYHFEDSLFG